jgi:hypothetical protein
MIQSELLTCFRSYLSYAPSRDNRVHSSIAMYGSPYVSSRWERYIDKAGASFTCDAAAFWWRIGPA